MGWLWGKTEDRPNASLARKLEELTERVEKLEVRNLETYLEVLDKAEKVAHKLRDRGEKRENHQPERARRPWEVPRGVQSP